MEDIRKSIKLKQELSFISAKNLFAEIFKEHNIDPSDILTEENSWFFSREVENMKENTEIHSNPTASEKNLMEVSCLINLNNIFSMIYKRNLNMPIDCFIEDMIETLFEINLQIKEREYKIEKNHKEIELLLKNLNEIEKIIIKPKNEALIEDNSIVINYVKDKSYCMELFKFYKLKYKAGINNDELKSIFSEEDVINKSCIIPLSDEKNDILIKIYGKKTLTKENEFKIISDITLPLMEIFTSISIKSLLNEKISPVYLILEFKDKSEDARFIGFNRFELKFDVIAGLERRMKIMKILKEYYENEINYFKESIKRRIILMENLLNPFKNEIYYDIEAGLISKKTTKKGSFCELNCLIY